MLMPASPRLPGHPSSVVPALPDDGHGPRFLVTVDTEEEFDWTKPFSRESHGLDHVPSIDKFQRFIEAYGVRPVYLIDYPVARDPAATRLLKGLADSNRASIGMQLHPWVNPPFEEAIDEHNSYACNLPPALERAKLLALHDLIVSQTGVRPLLYRAGRYGAGPASCAALVELGVRFDTSVRAGFDYSRSGGPDYAGSPLSPYWIDPGKLAELPLTSLFTGSLRRLGPRLFSKASGRSLLRAGFARTGLLERIALTPEGIALPEALRAIDAALADALPLLVFSFHSPSLRAGYTPYVRDRAGLDRFYDWWRGVLHHLKTRGVQPITIEALHARVFG